MQENLVEAYGPKRVRVAAGGILAPTLRSWHNQDGLDVGNHQENGRRIYVLTDAALVMWVASVSGADGAGRGFMGVRPAARIANSLRDPLRGYWASLLTSLGEEVLTEIGRAGPMALAERTGRGWRVELHANSADWITAQLQRSPRPILQIDIAHLLQRAVVALSTPAAESYGDE